ASVFDTIPMGLLLDPAAANLAALQAPIAPTGVQWSLLPVRAEIDVRIERFLQKANILRPDTVLAVRIMDDQHDVFSSRRCAVHAAVTPQLGPGVSVDPVVRAAVLESVNSDPSGMTTAQRDYIRTLVDPNATSDARDAAEAAYVSDLGDRLSAEAAKLDSPAGRSDLEARWMARQASA